MNYREACRLSAGQEYAMATPLKALPQARPDPEQEAIIFCQARVVPQMDTSWTSYLPEKKYQVHMYYLPNGNAECIMDHPNCANCRIANIAKNLESGDVVLNEQEFKNRDLSRFVPKI